MQRFIPPHLVTTCHEEIVFLVLLSERNYQTRQSPVQAVSSHMWLWRISQKGLLVFWPLVIELCISKHTIVKKDLKNLRQEEGEWGQPCRKSGQNQEPAVSGSEVAKHWCLSNDRWFNWTSTSLSASKQSSVERLRHDSLAQWPTVKKNKNEKRLKVKRRVGKIKRKPRGGAC